MSALINKKLEEIKQTFSLFYGARYTRKELANRFHEWRKSADRDPAGKEKIIVDGSRSQLSLFSRQWKWVILQTILWLIISFRFNFPPVINLMAFLTIFTQFTHNIMAIAIDKRHIFNTFITQEILSARSLSILLWETLSDLEKGKDDPVHVSQVRYAPDCEWTDITLQLLANKYDKNLPRIRIVIGHESSELLDPSSLGLVQRSDQKKEASSFILLKLFGRHSSFMFEGHSSQKLSVQKKVEILRDIFIIYFGKRDISPIVQNEISGSWECFINIDDRTSAWEKTEKERGQDISDMLFEWVPLDEEPERIDEAAEAHKMKGYGW